MSFKKNKYSVFKNAITKELAEFTYQYFLNKRNVARFLFDQKYISPFTEYFGVWNDSQVPNTYSHYGDIVMETLLQKVKPVMEKHTGLKLSETYSYARIYKKGGGHHTLHTHWNGHISGFYFLKASERTSMPLFDDPRAGNVMNLLPEKDKTKITYASSQISFKVKPGRMIFFPSYMPHQYIVDMGYEPFRFIHWNCQAIPKGVLNVV